MAVIYLIRHGQASFGQQNYDKLSALGQQQAEILGASLKQRLPNIDTVVLGDMLRHQQTMQACLSAMGRSPEQLPIRVDANWNEYDHNDILAQLGSEFGSAPAIEKWVRQQANPKAAFEQLFNRAMNKWMAGDDHTPYVESWQAYQARVNTALQQVVASAEREQVILVFSSGGPISVLSQSLLGVAATKVMQLNWTLVNCSVTKLVSTASRLFVSTLNDHSHFEGKAQNLITYK